MGPSNGYTFQGISLLPEEDRGSLFLMGRPSYRLSLPYEKKREKVVP